MTSPAPTAPAAGTRHRGAGVALIVLSGASFGTLPIFARLAYAAGGQPLAVLLLRFGIAAVVLAVVMALRGERWPRGRNLAALGGLGGLLYMGQSLSFFTALNYAPAGLVSLLLYLFPAIVLVLSVAFLGERLTQAKVVALALAVAGSALTIGAAGGGSPAATLRGIALGVASAVLYSVYIVVGSRVTPRAGPLAASTVIIASAAGTYGVLVLAQRPAFPGGVQGLLAVLGLALVATVVAIVTFFAGMARLGPSDASTLSTVEPAVTLVLAAAILGESVAPPQLAGGALILGAVVLLSRTRPV